MAKENFVKYVVEKRLGKTLTRCISTSVWPHSPKIVWAFQCAVGEEVFVVGSTVTMHAAKVRGWADFDLSELPARFLPSHAPKHFVIGTKAECLAASARANRDR